MAKTTQAQIIAAQRQTIEDQDGQLAALTQQLATMTAERDAYKALVPAPRPSRPVYVPPAPTEAQIAFRAKLAAAREQAMRTGQTVLVS